MRKWLLIISIILLLLWALYAFLFDWVVPKAATLTVPGRWYMIPLRQTKDIIHSYLGEPSVPHSKDESMDEWAGGSKGKMYFLKIYYVSDTLAGAYSIHYHYKNFFVSKDYLVDSLSIR